jgi:hypothetical protein
VAALFSSLLAGCALLGDDQIQSLDVSALRADEGYVVGTLTTVERFDNGTFVVLVDSPKVSYSVDVRPSRRGKAIAYSDMFQPVTVGFWNEDSLPSIDVNGAKGPVLFAVKVPAGPNRLASVANINYNATETADIDCEFDAAPGAVTYVGDIRLQIDTEQGLFGIHVWKRAEATVQENRPLLDKLLGAGFPEEHPELHVSLAIPVAAGR